MDKNNPDISPDTFTPNIPDTGFQPVLADKCLGGSDWCILLRVGLIAIWAHIWVLSWTLTVCLWSVLRRAI